jgi:hypothetical protein
MALYHINRILFAFVECTYRTYVYSMLLKILPCALYTSPRQYRLCKADYVYLIYLMLQRQLSRLNGRTLDRRQVSASYIFEAVEIEVTLRLYPCGGGVEYLHRDPASRKRRRNGTKRGRSIA